MGAVYALIAMGFSIVYRTMGLVNFAHADVVMIGAYVTVTFFLTARLPFGLSLLLAIVLTGALGLVIERILRPLESRDLNLMLIGTIGFGIVLQSVAILIWGTMPKDRKSTRLNSSHTVISYAVFCLKKKKKKRQK